MSTAGISDGVSKCDNFMIKKQFALHAVKNRSHEQENS